jgi:hypothetical protein
MSNAAARMARKIREYRAEPVRFVHEVVKVEPSPHQAKLLTSLVQHPRTSIRSGHGTGKTSGLAMAHWWFLCCFKNSRIPCTAPTSHQLEDLLWAEITKWGNRMEPWFRDQFDIKSDKVVNKLHPKTWYSVARTARKENPDALQGFHEDYLLFIIDEASGVHDDIFKPIKGAMTGKFNRLVMAGNPVRNSGYFFVSHHKGRALWNCLQFNSEDSPLVADSYIEEMIQEHGIDSDEYRVRVKGEFPLSSSTQLIARNLADDAAGRHLDKHIYIHSPKILGVDVARQGDDKSVIIRRQGLAAFGLKKFRIPDTMQLAARVVVEIDAWKPDAVFVDVVGMGAGVVDRLRQLGHEVIEVNVGLPALKSERFHNLRAEIWVKMRDWLAAGGAIPDDPEMVDDLIGLEYKYDVRQRYQMESKEDAKARGLASPDSADALALTFSYPVKPKAPPGHVAATRVKTNYNPLEHSNGY